MRTTLLFKDTELPPLENSGKSDIRALITEPLKVEIEAARRDAAANSYNVNPEAVNEDDITDD